MFEQLHPEILTSALVAIGVAGAAGAILFTLRRLIGRRVARLASGTDWLIMDLVDAALRKTSWIVVAAASLAIGTYFAAVPDRVHDLAWRCLVIAMFLQIGLWVTAAIGAWAHHRRQLSGPGVGAELNSLGVVSFLARTATWSIVVLLLLDNLGVNITALVAGLGVGGIAAALAVQNILGDVFASVSIALDKPFVVGDFIILGDEMGTLEFVGVKSSRIRSLSGEQIIVGNADLLSTRVRNYGRLRERRVVFTVGVTYETPRAKLASIPAWIREVVAAQPDVRFDRAHLKEFGDFAVSFEIVYFVLSPDYNRYMDIQQSIYLAVHAKFESERVEFAYPTSRLLIERLSAGGRGRRAEAVAG